MPKVKQTRKPKPSTTETEQAAPPSMSLIAPKGFAVAKQMTFRLRRVADDETIFAQIVSKIVLAQERQDKERQKGADGNPMGPPHICEIVEFDKDGGIMHEGEIVRIIVNKILLDTLNDSYPDDGYINRYFAIKKIAKRANKRYNEFAISELKKA